ncbi:MAG: hypothetical protein CR986_05965 [Ignavibacteriae bacterium]|nr:MAG: hypothetical protein CR986_05965 [Ignavibacteriota bacterium]
MSLAKKLRINHSLLKPQKNFYISIKYKIAFIVIVLLAICSFFINYYFPEKILDEKIKVLQLNANSSAKMAAYGIAAGIELKNYKPSDSEIKDLVDNTNLKYLIIFKDNSLYYEFNYHLASLNNFKNFNVDHNQNLLKSHADIVRNGRNIGTLYVGFSTELFYSNFEEVKEYFRNVSLGIFIIGSLMSLLIAKIFTNPLKEFVTSVDKISKGDFTEKVTITTNDELGVLANSFNNMLEKISEKNLKMDKINKELEKRVHDRTGKFEDLLVSLKKENAQRKKAEVKIKRSLNEKEILLKEIHHRVKNNLQIVSSLFFFQTKQINDPQMLDLLRDGQNRVKSMALIHEKLYQSSDLANVDFKEYINKLSNFLFQSYNINKSKIKLKINVQDIKLGVDIAVPCGLIINELISNSLKHGFQDNDSGVVQITMGYQEDNKLMLKINDNGSGLPDNFNSEKTDSLGLKLVNNLTTQLNGNIKFKNNNGTEVKLLFETPEAKK